MLLVQEFLKNHTFAELSKEHAIEASFSKSGHKFSLNYSMIDSRDDDVLAQQCRGLILAAADHRSFLLEAEEVNDKFNFDNICPGETIVISAPFFRFFNEGQGACAKINWNDPNLKVFEKLDGTLCHLYYSPIECVFRVATRSVPDADILMDNGKFTFRTLFEKAVQDTLNISFKEFTELLHKDYTYCFELTSFWNRIVCKYNETRITLLGARNLQTLKEISLEHDICAPFPKVKTYKLNNLQETLEYVSSRDPLEHEGVVVCDSNFNRVKIKNANYLALHRLCDGVAHSERNMLSLILNGQDDDALTVLPKEICDNILQIKNDIKNLIKDYDATYIYLKSTAQNKNPGNKKTFALLTNDFKHLWSAPFFQMYDGKCNNMLDYINKAKKNGTWPHAFLDKLLEMISK